MTLPHNQPSMTSSSTSGDPALCRYQIPTDSTADHWGQRPFRDEPEPPLISARLGHVWMQTQSPLCGMAARPPGSCLAFLAGEHKWWPQDRTLPPLLWVTAPLELWTQDLVAPDREAKGGKNSLTMLQSGWPQWSSTSSTAATVQANISTVNYCIVLQWKHLPSRRQVFIGEKKKGEGGGPLKLDVPIEFLVSLLSRLNTVCKTRTLNNQWWIFFGFWRRDPWNPARPNP